MRPPDSGAWVVLFAAITAVVLHGAGCATILGGTTDTVFVTSTQVGLEVTVDGVPSGTTPAALELLCDEPHIITVTTAGGRSQSFNVVPSLSGGYVLLDLLTGVVWILIDAATGAWYSLEPRAVHATVSDEVIAIPRIAPAPGETSGGVPASVEGPPAQGTIPRRPPGSLQN